MRRIFVAALAVSISTFAMAQGWNEQGRQRGPAAQAPTQAPAAAPPAAAPRGDMGGRRTAPAQRFDRGAVQGQPQVQTTQQPRWSRERPATQRQFRTEQRWTGAPRERFRSGTTYRTQPYVYGGRNTVGSRHWRYRDRSAGRAFMFLGGPRIIVRGYGPGWCRGLHRGYHRAPGIGWHAGRHYGLYRCW